VLPVFSGFVLSPGDLIYLVMTSKQDGGCNLSVNLSIQPI
jgi:hypothetical protein